MFVSWRPATLRIAVGPAGSEDVRVMQEIGRAFARERHFVRLSVVVTGSASEDPDTTLNNADLTVIRASANLPKDALTVAIFRKNFAVMWVAGQSGGKDSKKNDAIKEIKDLAGRRVGVIGKAGSDIDVLKLILSESGVPTDKVSMVQLAPGDFSDAIRRHSVDVFFAIAPMDSKVTADALAQTTKSGISPVFLPIDAAAVISRKHPVYEATEIAAGSFGANPARPDDDVTTIGINDLIVARKSLSELTVTAFTKQLFAIRHSLQTDFPGVTNIQVPDVDKVAAIPAHPGAAAYVEGNERSFLERYSDYMWLGLMALSALATGGAGFRGYMRRGERLRNTEMRNKLVEMISAARIANSVEELDTMQRRADEVLKDTLNCFDAGAVEEDTLSAFNLALDQLHNAVWDRKQSLGAGSQDTSYRAK